MSQNAQQFEEFLKSNNIVLDKTANEDLTTFVLREQIGAPGLTTVGVIFNNHDGLVNIVAYQFLRINKQKKHQSALELVNELNLQYTFIKYTLKDDLVTAHISVPFMDNFSPGLISSMIMSLINALRQDYPKFMALLSA